MVIPGSDGAEFMDELKPSPSTIRLDSSLLLLSSHLQQIGTMQWIMYKPRWGAFYNTLLEKIYEASERDFRIILAKDATSLTYDIGGLQELQNIGVYLINTDECRVWLARASYSQIQGRQ
ncbi:MAG: hypothetical protein K0S91_1120 [Nitrososphaeraceae archaeon]|nr:hypothetical protein [Nitrososphaeraceae archaeon]